MKIPIYGLDSIDFPHLSSSIHIYPYSIIFSHCRLAAIHLMEVLSTILVILVLLATLDFRGYVGIIGPSESMAVQVSRARRG